MRDAPQLALKRLGLSLLMCTVVLLAAACWYGGLNVGHRETIQLQRRLDQSDDMKLVLTQHVDEVFGAMIKQLPPGQQLPSGTQQLLRTWLQFDRQFLDQCQADSSLRLERATAHRRLGYCHYLLGETSTAVHHFGTAAALLQDLAEDHPTVAGYYVESADTHALRGWALRSLGNREEAAAAFRESIRLLDDNRVPRDIVRQERLAELREELGSLNLHRRES